MDRTHSKTRLNLFWFRRDLRISDNQGLWQACRYPEIEVWPIFIIDPYFFYQWPDIGKLRVRFMLESLQELDVNLQKLGSRLYLLEGNSQEIWQRIYRQAQEQFALSVYFNRDRQISYGQTRDQMVLTLAKQHNCKVYIGSSNFLLLDPAEMPNWRKLYYEYQEQPCFPTPKIIRTNSVMAEEFWSKAGIQRLSLAEFQEKYKLFMNLKSPLFTGGTSQAELTLNSFLDHRFVGYHWKLSRPEAAYLGATSHLSPHIMWGTLSVRQIYQKVYQKIQLLKAQQKPKLSFSLQSFLDRLRWRESFTQRLYFHPHYADQNWYSEFDQHYNWNLTAQQAEYYEKWKQGETGFLLIDAAMKQLQAVGWLNFRLRAMCATFLCINCGVSWHWGARHFMNTLVDGDIAIDSWQWQMQAGITNPLQPAFRIYDPDKNLLEKDPQCAFVKRWLPEISQLEAKAIQNYRLNHLRPPKMLNFQETKRTHGKIIADLRKQVRARLLQENSLATELALTQKTVVEKYYQNQQKRYLESQTQSLFDDFREGNE